MKAICHLQMSPRASSFCATYARAKVTYPKCSFIFLGFKNRIRGWKFPILDMSRKKSKSWKKYKPSSLRTWDVVVVNNESASHRKWRPLHQNCPIRNARHNARLINNLQSLWLVCKASLESEFARNQSKNKLVCKNALTQKYGSCTLLVMGPVEGLWSTSFPGSLSWVV